MVTILLGSKTDLEWGKEIAKYLEIFGIMYKIRIASAHKTPEHLLNIVKDGKEVTVYICVAGRSNALGGFVDANTNKPVINCPPPSEKYAGLDILSSLRMPSGVAPLTVLEPEQAALSAAKIIGLTSEEVKNKVEEYRKKVKESIINADINQS